MPGECFQNRDKPVSLVFNIVVNSLQSENIYSILKVISPPRILNAGLKQGCFETRSCL